MTPEQSAALREPFPPESVGKLPKAGIELDFVGHANVTDRLLEVDPGWVWEPFALNDAGEPLVTQRGNKLRMWIWLEVAGVRRPGVGTCSADAFEPDKELISDAIRNAAMRYGVALALWSREELESQHIAPEPLWRQLGWSDEDAYRAAVDDVRDRTTSLGKEARERAVAALSEAGWSKVTLTPDVYPQALAVVEQHEADG